MLVVALKPLGSITKAVETVRRVAGFSLLVNVECQNVGEAHEAIKAGANIVMLDNIEGEALHSAAKQLKDEWRGKREFLIETSGGIVEGSLTGRVGPGEQIFPELNLATVLTRPDIDILSTSAVHQVSTCALWPTYMLMSLNRAVRTSTFR